MQNGRQNAKFLRFGRNLKCLLAYLEYDISKCWHRLKTPFKILLDVNYHWNRRQNGRQNTKILRFGQNLASK
jgi:hypothetical protein